MKCLFLDESGDHSLTRIDPQYPVFVLGGAVVDAGYAEGELTRRLERFKPDVLGTSDVTLHTADIVRTRGAFAALKDVALRQRFYAALNRVMRELDYKVVACAIKKDAHVAAYGLAALEVGGTAYLPPSVIKQRLAGLHLRDKKRRIAGLELADLVVSPIGRFVAGLPPREDFEIVREKLRRRDGEHRGAGLVILPKG